MPRFSRFFAQSLVWIWRNSSSKLNFLQIYLAQFLPIPCPISKPGHIDSGWTPGLATNSICFCFLCVKNHWFAWRANQWPLAGETLFSSVPPSNSLVSVLDLRRAFWADTASFSGPRLASCVVSGATEIQGHRQVCRARRGGPRTLSTTDTNLDCAFVENALIYTNPRLWKVNRIELS